MTAPLPRPAPSDEAQRVRDTRAEEDAWLLTVEREDREREQGPWRDEAAYAIARAAR